MKKLLITTIIILAIGIIVFAQTEPPFPMGYHGPYDDTCWTGWDWEYYDDAIFAQPLAHWPGARTSSALAS